MKITHQKYSSPAIPNQLRSLIIIEPEKLTDQTPICFFYDGHVLKLGYDNFNNPHGIEITKLLPNAIIIALSTINDNEKNKWAVRKKELLNQKNKEYTWNVLVKEIVQKYQKKYPGKWVGFGFSLSGFLVLENQHLFDQVIAISPYLKDLPVSENRQGHIFYGSKEYLQNAPSLINKPIALLVKHNSGIKSYELPNMIHDFPSWTAHFPEILQTSLPFYRNGYLNFVQKHNDQYIRISGQELSNWNNELLILKALKIPYQVTKNVLTRAWIPGQVIDQWNDKRINNLKNEINKLHALKISGLTKHNWLKYEHYKNHVTKNQWSQYLALIEKYQTEKLVVSHNDLNKENMLVNNDKITFIDYEWANLNHPYFDYIQFYIAENIRIDNLSKDIFQEWVVMCLIYFILWTYAMPQNKQVLTWRSQYRAKLAKFST